MLLGITPDKQLRRKLFQRKVAQSRKTRSLARATSSPVRRGPHSLGRNRDDGAGNKAEPELSRGCFDTYVLSVERYLLLVDLFRGAIS